MLNNPENKLPESYQTKVCELLETFGHIEDWAALADYLGVTLKALSYFLRSNKAKAAQSLYIPGTRDAAKTNLTSPERIRLEPALPDTAYITDGMFIHHVVPDSVVGAYAIRQDRRGLRK